MWKYTFLWADDWKSDQIRWINDAVHLLPRKNPVFWKTLLFSRHREWLVLQEMLRSMKTSYWIKADYHYTDTTYIYIYIYIYMCIYIYRKLFKIILPFLSFIHAILRKGQQLLCKNVIQPSTSLLKVVKETMWFTRTHTRLVWTQAWLFAHHRAY